MTRAASPVVGGVLPHLRPLGSGWARRLDAPPKAALLDRAAEAGLPVPSGVVVREPTLAGVSAAMLARQLTTVLPSTRVAVRSAFAAEDGVTDSNAGRFTTVLDVDTADAGALAAAVETVLASAPGDATERAVIVQRLVAARHAGVAFTEPAYEDDLVDVVEGLAEGLVSGTVAGDRVALPRATVGEARRDGWQGRLQTVLRRVRDEFGDAPGGSGWDVEWADDGATCWLVQVRPITAAPRRDEALTLANHREILPDPPSALMTSLVIDAAPDTFAYWRRFAPDLPLDRPFVEAYAGRPLLNLSLLADTMRRLGLPTSFVTDSIGGTAEVDVLREVGPRPLRLLRHLRALVGLGLDQLRAPGTSDRTVAALLARTDRLDGDLGATLDAARDCYVELLHGMFALTSAIAGPLAVLQRLGVSAEHHARHRSAGTAVWDDLTPLRALVHDDATRRAAITRGEVPDDDVFARAWSTFLDDHGHRGVYESDLARPRYHEDPSPLLATLLVEDRDRPAPPRTTVGVLTLPLWWQAARAIRSREDLRSGAMRAFDRLRSRLSMLAEAAATDGLLPDAAAVWDCTTEQLRAVDRGVAVDARELAAARDRLAELARLRLPDVVRRSDDPLAFDPSRTAADAADATRPLRGLPLTPGDVTGTVWRLDEPSHDAPPFDGPVVLVAPGVDAGWIATFARVDAVVVETGGELSHGSIILRERSVPAVTNVARATSLVDGSTVRVRAGAGVVEPTGG